MAVIASWSPVHGQAKITVNASTLAAYMAIAKDKSTLLIDGQFEYGKLREIFRINDDDGINQIFTFAHTGNLDKDKLRIYSTSIIEKRLYLIGATKQRLLIDNICESFEAILKHADETFDYVIVDTNAGLKDPLTQCILQAADMVIVNLPQDDYIIKKYFDRHKDFWPMFFEKKQCVYVIGDYHNQYDHYNLKRIQRKYKLSEIFSVPNNKHLHKSLSDRRFMQWMIANYEICSKDRKDYNYSFFSSLDSLADRILQAPKKKSLFEKIKENMMKNVAGM